MRFPGLLLALLLTACDDPSDPKPDDTAAPSSGEDTDTDADGDGVSAEDGDCDDDNASVSPNADERCDGVDNDCDGSVDEDDAVDASDWYADTDRDGFGDPAASQTACEAPTGTVENREDCDDTNKDTFPGADEFCDLIDNDCDGTSDEDDAVDAIIFYRDTDRDGFGDPTQTTAACIAPAGHVSLGTDCDDDNETTFPGADEFCDTVDNDCDGTTDEDDAIDAPTWYIDGDTDGFGDASTATRACAVPDGYVSDNTDCDDEEGTTFPGADEFCDTVDNDCDSTVDEDDAIDAITWYADTDEDGFGDPDIIADACAAPDGYVGDDTDCDDREKTTFPGADEFCDTVDNDCDGITDEDDAVDASRWYADTDLDRYGDPDSETVSCTAPSGYISDNTDCDDDERINYPGADEYCDDEDNDCDGVIDEDDAVDASDWYADTDRDGYGDDDRRLTACEAPTGYVRDDTDCDDSEKTTFPGADEFCDTADNDCDGTTDEDDAVDAETFYADIDEDGFGDVASTTTACSVPDGYVSNDEDCDDSDSGQNPDALEYCNKEDDDCDSLTDEGEAVDAPTWYTDTDGDGFGGDLITQKRCLQPTGTFASADDCDDNEKTTYPDADERCDTVDNDCDGITDEDDAVDAETWYLDDDGDGFGDAAITTEACTAPTRYLSDNTDCDDDEETTFPGADERCDTIDNDCDGTIDEDDAIDAITWYADTDEDGFGDPDVIAEACAAPDGYLSDDTDCDDDEETTFPGADETCDTVDNDCDGITDEDDAVDAETWYLDDDGDGFGGEDITQRACKQPTGAFAIAEDCDDSEKTTYPGADERCDTVDNDCDGITDEDDAIDAITWYADTDEDGFGDPDIIADACAAPDGYVGDDTDCDDDNETTFPGADERCDTVDNDCDTAVDEDDAVDAPTWYIDGDTDGFGDASTATRACAVPDGYVSDNTDCDDEEGTTFPGADEFCDTVDNDCDGTTDEDDALDVETFYVDDDDDTFGDPSASTSACEAPDGYVRDNTDCDDGSGTVNPDADEVCDDGVDNDCDGTANSCRRTGTEDLGDADHRMTGENIGDYAGNAITVLGDMDSDGYDDFAVGATSYGTYGQAYLVNGPLVGDTDLGAADVIISSGTLARSLGAGFAGRGDLDDDDHDDLLIYDRMAGRGEVYLYHGPITADLSVSDAIEIRMPYSGSGAMGEHMDFVGDVNDDDIDDILLSTRENSETDASRAGGAFLVHGPITASDSVVDLAVAHFIGESDDDYAGSAISRGGDMNGDGYADLLIGADSDDDGGSGAGAVYQIFGPVSGEIDLSDADGKLIGGASDDNIGNTVQGGADLNGDGYEDILVGGVQDGVIAYIIEGPTSGRLLIESNAAAAFAGATSSGGNHPITLAGDVDGDGEQDIAIASSRVTSSDLEIQAGGVYLFYGPFSGAYDDGDAGLTIYGKNANDRAGTAITAGDIDGDGLSDLIVGATYASGTQGGAYLFLGSGL